MGRVRSRASAVGLVAALALALSACAGGIARVPPDPPATPLTAEQLAQYPLPSAYPDAREIVVRRGTYDIPPDAPGPKKPRYSRRETEYTASADPQAILGFYRETLPRQGWSFCDTGGNTLTLIDYYNRAGAACDRPSAVNLRVAIYVRQGSPYSVTVIEDLPAPLEWPAPSP